MKRGVVLLALIGLMTAGVSGCILSATPDTGTTITLSVGESKTFAVTAFLNQAFTWYEGSDVMAGSTGASCVFTAGPEDADKLITIRVETTDLLLKTETKEWTVAVTSPPTADAGDDAEILFGTEALLDGSGSSDPENSALTYQWSVTTHPNGSTADFSDDTLVNPTFKPDVEGTYVISLVVNDGLVDSEADTVTITTFTYNQGFESGIAAPWTVPVANNAMYTLTGDYVHGGSVSFQPEFSSGIEGDNQIVLRLTLPPSTFVYSISTWMYREGWASSAVHSHLLVDGTLMLNGVPAPRDPHAWPFDDYHILDPKDPDIWVLRTWAVNATVSVIDFVYNDLFSIDDIYLDDIMINTWGD